MGRFSKEITINAPQEKVWAVLADLGNIYRWNPGVSHSYTTSENSKGEDATRHCDIERPLKGYLEERAFDWREGEGYKIAIYDTNFPNKDTVIDFSVRAEGDGTKVEVSPEYKLKFGLLGKLMDRLFFERQFRKGMTGLLRRNTIWDGHRCWRQLLSLDPIAKPGRRKHLLGKSPLVPLFERGI